ncbi:hypothetical protein PTRA_a0054 [Pseudoalteromonas translucida KMM 520]|uniref:Lipoprotein n=1 Tax=Pseudoalteromonas translucida KMM 520 TaxID=1315283 RepID=A0A0U2WHU5_9GAMM|nr:hypothetical protein [Pseudoalteromonas translucida]ALS31451.1 hypothetical protein PTRA_a0054 [Pseudoalteromonas translucida KMM 520]
MRTTLLAIFLPLCLTACLDNPVAETEKTTASETTAPSQQQLQKSNKAELHTPAEKLSNTAMKAVTLDDIKAAKNELNTLIANKQCDSSTQCQVEAVGSRACGGPSSYVVYSTTTATTEQVTALSKKITTFESNYNAQNQMVSICQHLTAPSTQCVENKCVKLEGSAVSVF